jgi:hypothetical protein
MRGGFRGVAPPGQHHGQPDRVEDLLIPCAPTQVAGQSLADIGVGGYPRGAPQEVVGLHDQPGCAEAALHGARVDERLLHRVQPFGPARCGMRLLPGQALDRDHLAASRLAGRDQARANRHVIEQDRA